MRCPSCWVREDDEASVEVRRLAMGLLTAHRGRLVELGLEDPEDLSGD
jgi:hypothetical protein